MDRLRMRIERSAHREKGGDGPVDDRNADVAERLHHALVAGAVLVHEAVRQMRAVVDRQAEGEHKHNDGDGVDVEPPPVHVAHDVHHHQPHRHDHQEGRQRVDDVHQHDQAHRHHREGEVHGGFPLDGLVLLVVEIRRRVREDGVVAGLLGEGRLLHR
eukprot:1316241-Pyramimonas_sp.AAC.1